MFNPPNNYVIKEALKDNIITKEDFDIIFIDKANWFTLNDDGSENWGNSTTLQTQFWNALKKLEPYFLETSKYYDYNDVIFPPISYIPSDQQLPQNFKRLVRFSFAKFYGISNFHFRTFEEDAMFDNSHFYNHAIFLNSTFKKSAHFHKTMFEKDAAFASVEFESKVMFIGTTFKKLADFRNSDAKKILFTNTIINRLDLFACTFDQANFLEMHNYPKTGLSLSKEVCKNKETARLIKSALEKDNNITEANKYFPIEQELYIGQLHNNKSPNSNRYKNLFVLYLNKYVSYFGTDWVRPLLVMFIFGFFASFWYSYLQSGTENINFKDPIIRGWLGFGFLYFILIYISYHRKYWKIFSFGILSYLFILMTEPDLRYVSNEISKLMNPLNIFKQTVNYFEHIAIYGMIVKLGMATLIYQFIVAFRQNTRRK